MRNVSEKSVVEIVNQI